MLTEIVPWDRPKKETRFCVKLKIFMVRFIQEVELLSGNSLWFNADVVLVLGGLSLVKLEHAATSVS